MIFISHLEAWDTKVHFASTMVQWFPESMQDGNLQRKEHRFESSTEILWVSGEISFQCINDLAQLPPSCTTVPLLLRKVSFSPCDGDQQAGMTHKELPRFSKSVMFWWLALVLKLYWWWTKNEAMLTSTIWMIIFWLFCEGIRQELPNFRLVTLILCPEVRLLDSQRRLSSLSLGVKFIVPREAHFDDDSSWTQTFGFGISIYSIHQIQYNFPVSSLMSKFIMFEFVVFPRRDPGIAGGGHSFGSHYSGSDCTRCDFSKKLPNFTHQ